MRCAKMFVHSIVSRYLLDDRANALDKRVAPSILKTDGNASFDSNYCGLYLV